MHFLVFSVGWFVFVLWCGGKGKYDSGFLDVLDKNSVSMADAFPPDLLLNDVIDEDHDLFTLLSVYTAETRIACLTIT